MGNKLIRYFLGTVLVGAIAICLNPATAKEKEEGGDHVIAGLGTIAATTIRCTLDLSDCGDQDPSTTVQFVVRETSLDLCDGNPTASIPSGVAGVAFSGLIQNAKQDGDQLSRILREACSGIPQGTAKVTYTLENAVVTDPETGQSRKGGLEIEAQGIFEGDATSPNGARLRYHSTVRGISGQLRGAHGEMEIVFPRSTTSFTAGFYYAELRVPGL